MARLARYDNTAADAADNMDCEVLTDSQVLEVNNPSMQLTQSIDGEPPSKKYKPTKVVSSVWTNFDKVAIKSYDGTLMKKPDGTSLMKAVCKICNEHLVYGGNSGTSHLCRHMLSCIKRSSVDRQQTVIGRTPAGDVFSFTFNQKTARQETVRYFVREEIAFIKVEKPSFRRWIRKAFGPQFKPPCRITMRDDVIQSFQEEKAVLKEQLHNLPGKICLTSDMWTSIQKLGYLCITAHFIASDWKLHKRVISFPVLPSPHSGKAISEAIYACLLGWNVCDKVATLSLDNAANNDNAVNRLNESLFGDQILSKELFHVRCNAHIINLLVQEVLDFVQESLDVVRECIKHVKSSSGKLQSFFDDCKSLNMKGRRLPIDMPIRWNSTYFMLMEAIPYRKVFDLFFCGSEVLAPSDEDWKSAEVLRDFLKVFYDSTRLFSGTSYVTSSEFCYQLSKMSLLLKKHGALPYFKVMCANMTIKYDRYWKDVPIVLGLAACMDPRYKFTFLELCLDFNHDSDAQSQLQAGCPPHSRTRSRAQLQPQLESAPSGSELKLPAYKRKLDELFDEYQLKLSSNESSNPIPNVVDEEDMVLAMLSKRRESRIDSCKSDLQRYLDQPVLKYENDQPFDILDWWRRQEATYPVLSALARDLLTIQVSTVASESAFSASGRILSKHRSCLLPETVEALMCLGDWYQAEEGLQDEDMKDIEEMMREEL